MEVFNVFATLSLVDMMSGPLARIRGSVAHTENSVASLGQRMGSLAMSMAPVALAAGALLAAFGAATSKAIAFESAMADVAKVVSFETAAEFKAMNQTVMDMAGRIPMAAEGIAAIIAAAGQSGVAKQDLAEFAETAAKMGVAFDLTGDQAGKMMSDWRAGMDLTLPQVYSLADAVNHLSNNMNATAPALGEVIQRVGAVAMSCGLAETQVAALGAAFLSAGASPEVAATALKSFTTTLVKGTAMSKDQAAAFASIGLSATQLAKDMQTDAQGTIFKVLQAIADKPKELQMSLLTEMFGQESIGAIAPLLKNMGNLSNAFELVGDSARYAGSMQKEFEARSKTAQNALILLGNKLTNLAISVGNVFLPAISWGANALGVLVDAIRSIIDTPFGQWLVGAAGALATAVLAVTGFSAAMWAITKVAPLVTGALAPIKAALLTLGWPIWAVIAAVGALYVAYRTNFGGMADTLNRWWKNITLVVKGVLALFQSLKDGSGEIRGELATEIKAAGLVGLVSTVARAVYRIREFFVGLWDALDFSPITEAFAPVGRALSSILQTLGNLFARVFGGEVNSAASSARSLGEVLGGALSASMRVLGNIIEFVALGVENMANVFGFLVSLFTGDFAAAGDYLKAIFEGLGRVFAKFGDLVGSIFGGLAAIVQGAWDAIASGISAAWEGYLSLLTGFWGGILSGLAAFGASILSGLQAAWDAVMASAGAAWESVTGLVSDAWESIVGSIAGFGASLLAGIQDAWNSVLAFFDGINLFESGEKLLSTFVDGIKSMAMAPIEAVSGILSSIREYLPFSDAKIGPLSTLTLSGQRMMTTLGEGILGGAASLLSTVTGALSGVGEKIGGWWDSLWGDSPAPEMLPPAAPVMPEVVPPAMAAPVVPPPDVPMIPTPEVPVMEIKSGSLPDMPQPVAQLAAQPFVTPTTLTMPQARIPEIDIPDAPEWVSPARQGKTELEQTESGPSSRTVNIYGEIHLHGVQNPQDFWSALDAEIAMTEGAMA